MNIKMGLLALCTVLLGTEISASLSSLVVVAGLQKKSSLSQQEQLNLWQKAKQAIDATLARTCKNPLGLPGEIDQLKNNSDLVAFKKLSNKEQLQTITIDYHQGVYPFSSHQTQAREAAKTFFAIHNLPMFKNYELGLFRTYQKNCHFTCELFIRDVLANEFDTSEVSHIYTHQAENSLKKILKK